MARRVPSLLAVREKGRGLRAQAHNGAALRSGEWRAARKWRRKSLKRLNPRLELAPRSGRRGSRPLDTSVGGRTLTRPGQPLKFACARTATQSSQGAGVMLAVPARPGPFPGPGAESNGKKGFVMSDLVFIAFDTEKQAEEVRDKVLGMQREYLIDVEDAAIATRDDKGRVKLNQLMHPTASGALSVAFWGMLIGWIFLMPVAGAAVGAAGGALGGALVDVGINDQDMRTEANEALKPGTAGLFLLIRKMTTDKVLEDLKGAGGRVIKTSFDHAKEEALKAALAGQLPAAPAEAAKA